jgi:hypothetical protein
MTSVRDPGWLRAPDKTSRARRIVEDSTLVRRDECNAAMGVLPGTLKLPTLGARITLGTCLRNHGMARNVGHDAGANRPAAHYLIVTSIKKLP